jgi:hypothetical protein
VDERIMWEKIILPRFGKMKVAAITANDIDSLHHDITTVRCTPTGTHQGVRGLVPKHVGRKEIPCKYLQCCKENR